MALSWEHLLPILHGNRSCPSITVSYCRKCFDTPVLLGKKEILIPFTAAPRFQAVPALLQQIRWLEVVGEMEFQFPVGTYGVFFGLQLGKSTKRPGSRVSNFEHIHGWDRKPVKFQLTTSDGQKAVSQVLSGQSRLIALTPKVVWALMLLLYVLVVAVGFAVGAAT